MDVDIGVDADGKSDMLWKNVEEVDGKLKLSSNESLGLQKLETLPLAEYII